MFSSVQVSLGTRLCEREVVFTMNYWNFKAIKKNHFDVCLKQTCLGNLIDSHR
jgi:hypothetical protein